MIQRLQTVYLFIGSLALLGTVFTDVMGAPAPSTETDALSWLPITLSILVGAIFILAIAAIFFYQNRQKQRQVIVWVQILTLLFVGVVFLGLYLQGALVSMWSNIGLVVGVALPIVAYGFFFLARRGVENDIKLIASMDRLR